MANDLVASLSARFDHLAGDDAVIDAAELQRALGLRAEYLARRVLAVFDADGDGVIRRDEFLEGVRKLVTGTPREKLGLAFRVHDHDGDGALDRQDLERMILLALAEDDVATSPARVEQLVGSLLAHADTNRDGRLSFEELEAAVARHPHLLERMTRDEARWIAPNEDLLARLEEARGGGGVERARAWRESGWAPVVIVVLFALANVALLALGMMQKARPGHPPLDLVARIAKATTTPIELDAGIVLLPVLRRVLTWVRRSWLGHAIPVDDAVEFHRIVGHTLFALCAAHGAAELVGYARGTKSFLSELLSERGWTGATLLGVFLVMWVCAWQVIRRTQRFELFYFTHLLYLVWFPLAIAHAPGVGGAAALALLGLGIELFVRGVRRGKKARVVSTTVLRSGVTRIELARPPGFVHRAGDYVFLKMPAVARHEWHPYTLTSAPEAASLTMHVRALGNWTSALRGFAEARGGAGAAHEVEAWVDGPYGSPSGEVFESRFAVLIGAGIGVTPFASILESVVLRAGGGHGRPAKLERAHFYWLNRDQYSFEWFAALLAELERIDGAGVLETHIWMTGGKAGVASVGLELARAASHAAGHHDVVTGLRTHTHVGAPDWNVELRRIAELHSPAKVDVFFCGPPGLGKKVRAACAEVGMRYREEKF